MTTRSTVFPRSTWCRSINTSSGIKPLNSPYKMIAADANHSNSITTFDVVEIRKLILGIYSKFPNNTSWRFATRILCSQTANSFTTPFPEEAGADHRYAVWPERRICADQNRRRQQHSHRQFLCNDRRPLGRHADLRSGRPPGERQEEFTISLAKAADKHRRVSVYIEYQRIECVGSHSR